MNAITKVSISRFVEKQIEKLPYHIRDALALWISTVEEGGIQEARKSLGYHDEPLYGDRPGQRSARLNRAYRVFYIEVIDAIEIVVIEVNKHDY